MLEVIATAQLYDEACHVYSSALGASHNDNQGKEEMAGCRVIFAC